MRVQAPNQGKSKASDWTLRGHARMETAFPLWIRTEIPWSRYWYELPCNCQDLSERVEPPSLTLRRSPQQREERCSWVLGRSISPFSYPLSNFPCCSASSGGVYRRQQRCRNKWHPKPDCGHDSMAWGSLSCPPSYKFPQVPDGRGYLPQLGIAWCWEPQCWHG